MIAALDLSLNKFEAYANPDWRDFFLFLKEHASIVTPPDPTPLNRFSYCLTHNEPSFAFYHFWFPILKELKIKILLGIPTAYIQDENGALPKTRLNTPYHLRMQEGVFEKEDPFCSWEEIKEMVSSGYVYPASLGYLHCNLNFPFVNLEQEVIVSKSIIEKKVGVAPLAFFYPFGKYNPYVQELTFKQYLYAFAGGDALNFSWGKGKRVLNRIALSSPKHFFSLAQLSKFFVRSLMIG